MLILAVPLLGGALPAVIRPLPQVKGYAVLDQDGSEHSRLSCLTIAAARLKAYLMEVIQAALAE
jgi:hypothetical protein